jgi:dual oxidase
MAAVLRPYAVPRPYRDYVASLPDWSGIVAFDFFWILGGHSMPLIRKRSYEILQLGHSLMLPIIGLLCAHGTAGLLQYHMLGYWLASPTLLIFIERVTRIACSFRRIPATLEILDADTVVRNVTIPNHRYWPYEAGQYIFLQVPKLSLFQWHPFTISTCIGTEMQVHIKTDGDWTSKLRNMVKEGQVESIHV